MESQQSSEKNANTNLSSFSTVNKLQGDQTVILQHKIKKYVDGKKKFYNYLMIFLEDTENLDNNFQNLIDIINIHHEIENRENFEHFLYLLTDIANNFHCDNPFFTKIFQILKYYQDQIKQTFSNIEIYKIFQSNKLILLFLFENKVITVDDKIYSEMINKKESNGYSYCHFFYPEVKEFTSDLQIQKIKEELLAEDPNIFNYLSEKRRIGQNDSYICSLIRQDLVEDFISHVNKLNIPLTYQIKHSLFETNSFLIENKPTLIEYSAFYGSIQIFQYLVANNVELTPLLWLYAIHSRNPEIIRILESYKINPPTEKEEENDKNQLEEGEKGYERIFIESIKCHHNNIANYINDSLMPNDYNNSINREEFISNILQYHNYNYFPNDFKFGYEFYFLCCFNYNTLVDLYVKRNEKDFEEKINKEITF